MIVVMVRIPIGTPEEGEQLAERFRRNLSAVEGRPGFEGFELLKGQHEYISVTRWESREALEAWTASQDHAAAHGHGRGHASPQPAQTGGHPAAGAADAGTHSSTSGAVPASSTLMYEVVIP